MLILAFCVSFSLHWQGSFIRVSKFNENYSSVASETAYGLMPTIQLKKQIDTHTHIHIDADAHGASGQSYVLESIRLKLWQFAIIIGITLHYWMFIVLIARLFVVHVDMCMCMCMGAYACLWQPMCFYVIAFQRRKCIFEFLALCVPRFARSLA